MQMKRRIIAILVFISPSIFLFAQSTDSIDHYIYYNRDRDLIRKDTFLIRNTAVEGAQLKYTWRELEPQEGRYNLQIIEEDLKFLKKAGKKLIIQIQDVSFADQYINVPKYLLENPVYDGGIVHQYNDWVDPPKAEGWVAKRWHPLVQKQFFKLINALAKEFDGKIEAITLPETSITLNEENQPVEGFDYILYRDAIIKNMAACKKAFNKTKVIQYANFMPGEWLPWTNKHLLDSIYHYAQLNDIGIGGPDVWPYRKGQMDNSYQLIQKCPKEMTVAMAIQYSNYTHKKQRGKGQVSVEEMYVFARDYLKTDYLFWEIREPFYSKDVIPYLMKVSGKK